MLGPEYVPLLAQALVSGLLVGCVYALIATGFTVIFGVMRIANFAHGQLVMAAMYAAVVLYQAVNLDPLLAVFLIGPAFFVAGAGLYRGLFARVVHAPEAAQITLSIGLWFFLENLALFLFGGELKGTITPYAAEAVALGTVVASVPRLLASGVAIAVIVALHLFLQTSDLGRSVRAYADGPEGAVLAGVDPGRVNAIACGLGVACAGVAGAAIVPFFFVTPFVGLDFMLRTLVVVVLGGLGSMTGALVGGLLVGLIEAITGVFVPSSLGTAILFGVLAVVLLFRPAGLLGGRRS